MSLGSTRARRLVILVLPLLFLAWMQSIKFRSLPTYLDINYENHIVQNLQVFLYSIAAILLFVGARRFAAQPARMRWVVLAAALVVVFIIGEEIQWGQYLFHLQPSGFFAKNNVEHEINLHNLAGVDSRLDYLYIVIGLVGGFAWQLPGRLMKWLPLREWFIPPWFMMFYFLPLAAYGFLWKVLTKAEFLGGLFNVWKPFLGRSLSYADQEPAELLFASACVMLALGILELTRSKSQSQNTKPSQTDS